VVHRPGHHKVGRLTTSGKVTELAVGTGYRQLEGIADGTAGTIWFAETHGNSIARLSPHRPSPHRNEIKLTPLPVGRSA